MSIYEQDSNKIIKLSGRPKDRGPREARIWSQFLSFLKDKFVLANDYLAAKVAKEKAQAMHENAQAIKTLYEAKEIANRIHEKEEHLDISNLQNKDEQIERLINEINNDIKFLSTVKGTFVNIEITETESNEEINQSTATTKFGIFEKHIKLEETDATHPAKFFSIKEDKDNLEIPDDINQ